MKYKSVIVTRPGGPEVLQVIKHNLHLPSAGEVRIKVLASAVCRPDITVRRGEALYSGTPLGQKIPFVPGYAIIGCVDAVGEGVTQVAVGDRVGALTVVGGYSEYLYWKRVGKGQGRGESAHHRRERRDWNSVTAAWQTGRSENVRDRIQKQAPHPDRIRSDAD